MASAQAHPETMLTSTPVLGRLGLLMLYLVFQRCFVQAFLYLRIQLFTPVRVGRPVRVGHLGEGCAAAPKRSAMVEECDGLGTA
jgi:hypothetical protein